MRVRWHEQGGPAPGKAFDKNGNRVLNASGRVIQFLPDSDRNSGAKAVVLSDHSYVPGRRFVVKDIGDLAVDPPDKL